MKSHVTWALVGASVVLLGFTSMQFTDAAWSSSKSSAGADIRTGHLRITGAGSAALDVSGLAKESMNTGDQVQIPLVVQNDSTIPVNYRLTGVAAKAGTTPPALNLRVGRVADASQCPATPGAPGTQLYSGVMTSASTTNRTLTVDGAGATDVLCLTTTATAVEPGDSGSYIFTFEANQQ